MVGAGESVAEGSATGVDGAVTVGGPAGTGWLVQLTPANTTATPTHATQELKWRFKRSILITSSSKSWLAAAAEQ
jgi:hypothetical protein